MLPSHLGPGREIALFFTLCMYLLGALLYLTVITLIFYRLTVMQSTDPRSRDDASVSVAPRIHQSVRGRRLAEAQVRQVVVIVGNVVPQQSSEMALAEHDDMVEES